MKKVSETILNRFMDQVESKYIGKNPILRLISRIKLNKFCRTILKGSPGLGLMWFFADFIKLAERIYFFNVDKDKGIYSSRSYSAGENGFIINDKEHELKINIKLYSDDNIVKVEVKRNNGTNMTTNFEFDNGQWAESRENYDEVLVDNIIGIINSHMVALTKWCWKRKGTFDNINLKL